MTKLKNDPKRNRKKDLNLAGLYAVTHETAYKNGKLRPGVYGYVSKGTPYICKPGSGDGQVPKYVHDMTGDDVPKVLKGRMVAFWADTNNRSRKMCWLAEKSLYKEMVGEPTQKISKKGSSKGKNSARKSGTTSYKNSTSKKATSRDNNSLW